MIALGLALILIAAGATIFAVIASATSSAAISLTAFGVTISASPLDLFIAGALSVVLLGLGFALISRGTRHSARRHKELKELRKDKAVSATNAAADRELNGAHAGSGDSTTDAARKGTDAKTAGEGTDKSTDKGMDDGTDTPMGRHSQAGQHSAV